MLSKIVFTVKIGIDM